MGLSPEIERALDTCYDAISAPQLWTAAMDNLVHSPGARACQVLPHAISQRPFGVARSSQAWRIHQQWQRNLDWVKEALSLTLIWGMRNFRKRRNFVPRAIVN